MRSRLIGAGAGALALGGCAQRGVVSGPTQPPSAGTWLAVWCAVALIVAVVAALVLQRAWRPGGARLAAGVLAVQVGGTLLGTALLAGAALRSGQLVSRPDGAEQAASLVRLSGIDGRVSSFYAVMAALVAILGVGLAVLLVLATRFAAGSDRLERAMATGVLGAEVLLALTAAGHLLLGSRSRVEIALVASLPLLFVATASCWPPPRSAGPGAVGYNGSHG